MPFSSSGSFPVPTLRRAVSSPGDSFQADSGHLHLTEAHLSSAADQLGATLP
jgi:hypothetical protein